MKSTRKERTDVYGERQELCISIDSGPNLDMKLQSRATVHAGLLVTSHVEVLLPCCVMPIASCPEQPIEEGGKISRQGGADASGKCSLHESAHEKVFQGV